MQNMAKVMIEICTEIVKEPRCKEHLMQSMQHLVQNSKVKERNKSND